MSRRAGHRRVTVHLLVENLQVPSTWRVGDVVFRPVGWLRERVEMDSRARDVPIFRQDFALPPLRETKWSSAAVTWYQPAASGNYNVSMQVARNATRDAIGVLRLLQRARYPLAPRNVQVFGLPDEVGSVLEYHWVEDTGGRFIGVGGQWRGSIGGWEFSRADIHAYRRDARFWYLNSALLSGTAVGWQQRLMTAMRTVAVATTSLRPSLRIVLLATALEALLGEEFVGGWRFDEQGKAIKPPQANAHTIGQRAAYLACIEPDGVRHHPRTPACLHLSSASQTKLREELYARQRGGDFRVCSAYEAVAALFEDRNAALHGASDSFTEGEAVDHEVTVDGVLLAALGWVVDSGATDIDVLADEIAALPRPDVPTANPQQHWR